MGDSWSAPGWDDRTNLDSPLYGTLAIDGPAAGEMYLSPSDVPVPKSIERDGATYVRMMATQERVDEEFKKAGFTWPVGPVYLYVQKGAES